MNVLILYSLSLSFCLTFSGLYSVDGLFSKSKFKDGTYVSKIEVNSTSLNWD